MLSMGAIEKSQHEDNEFISNIFLVKKKNGKFRPVINLKKLNKFVEYHHFKMETLQHVAELLKRYAYFTSVDLKNAYFSIPIHHTSRKYLKFSWKGTLYEFTCLPFGLSSAPRVFTKVMKPVFSYLRSIGICCFYYIDDSLNQDMDINNCRSNAELLIKTLKDLGFHINSEKLMLFPSQQIQYLGFIIDSVTFQFSLPDEKIEKILHLSSETLRKDQVSIREVTALIGLYNSASTAIQLGPLYHRYLDRDKCTALQNNFQNYDRKMIISEESKSEINWWIKNLKDYNGKIIRPSAPQIYIESDASLIGWGAILKDGNFTQNSTQGRWNARESLLHINKLELRAIYFSLLALCKFYNNCHICVRSDSATAVAYINRIGGSVLSLLEETKSIWNWCFSKNIFISAVHIPGKNNKIPDYLSREFNDCTEWMLNADIFKKLCRRFFKPKIDLFASRLNTQIPDNYVSWFPDPNAVEFDAFSLSWNNIIDPYIFSPFSQMAKVLQKIEDEQVKRVLLVCPLWTTQTWFPRLLAALIDFPVKLPFQKDLLTLAHNNSLHPMNKRKLFLIGCCVSGDISKRKEFQRKLQISLQNRGETPLLNSINIHGKLGCIGVVNNMLIQLHQMK